MKSLTILNTIRVIIALITTFIIGCASSPTWKLISFSLSSDSGDTTEYQKTAKG